MGDPIRVLHVDDDGPLAETTAARLERADERFDVETATDASDALARLDDGVDCIVSDYEMPGLDGIEFLAAVREEHPDLPFILYTARGSETVASDAISAGVTDYLQKETGAGGGQYALLANRVANAVEQYRTPRAAERTRRRLELFFDHSPLGIIEWNEAFELVRMNRTAEEILGYAQADLEGRSWETIVPPSGRDDVAEVTAALLADEGGYHSVNENVRKDGERIVCEWHNRVITDGGDVVAVLSQFQDVTERRERERELEERNERLSELTRRLQEQYRYLFEEAPVMAAVTRSENGRPVVEDCNRLFAERLGCDREEIIGRELATFYTPDSRARLLDEDGYRRALTGEFTRERRELVAADGTVIDALLRAVPRRDGLDDTAGTLAMYVDITERAELRRQNERLEEFASIVSHDLQNPLSVAAGRVGLAREAADGGNEHLEAAAGALARSQALIEDLLALAREGDSVRETEPVDLETVVEGCWRTVATGDATLVVETDATVRADESRLRQLLANLLSNAVGHGSTSSRSGTDDTVEHGSTGSQPVADDAVEHDGPGVTVTVGEVAEGSGFCVADDGPGIPAEERDRVFEAGYSTAADGTGFGLSIVAEIAAAHGWDVTAGETGTGGARVEVTGVTWAD